MMKARMLALLSLALGTASVALAQAPVQVKFSRVVDLTLPIESNMAPIPGLKPYLERGVAEYVANKGAAGLAIDVFPEKPLWRGVKLDPGEVWIANHLALMQKNLPLIQFVTNLSQIGDNRFTVVAVPLAIKGGDASPVRVVALVE